MPKDTKTATPDVATLYLATMEEVLALGDGHRRRMAERLGAGAAHRLRVLTLLTRGGMDGRTPTELAARMRMPRASLSRVLQALRAEGCVEEGDFRGDERCTSIWITEIGQTAIEEMVAPILPDLDMLANMGALRVMGELRHHAGQFRKQIATHRAYVTRGPRRRVVSV